MSTYCFDKNGQLCKIVPGKPLQPGDEPIIGDVVIDPRGNGWQDRGSFYAKITDPNGRPVGMVMPQTRLVESR